MPRPRTRVTVNCKSSEPKTQQQYKASCDINNILKKYHRDGVISPDLLNKRHAVFGDVSNFGDFQESQNKILEAREAFMTLPAKLRARFDNDPAKCLDFATNPDNWDEMVKLGMVKPPNPEIPPASAPLPTESAPEATESDETETPNT